MVQTMGDSVQSQSSPQSDDGSKRRTGSRLSLMWSLRLPQNGELLRRIVRAARARGVPPSTYVRARIRACVRAELDGKSNVHLGSVEHDDVDDCA